MTNETDLGGTALTDGTGYEGPRNPSGHLHPEGTHNKQKAEEQAHAEEAGRIHVAEYHDEHFRGIDEPWEGDEIDPRALAIGAYPYGEKAGDDYEIRKVAERYGKTEQEVIEKMALDKQAMLEYGVTILNNKREFGEKLSLGEETFITLADFAREHPEIMKGSIEWGSETVYLYPIPMEANVLGEGMKIVGSFLRFGYRSDGRNSSGKTETWEVGPYRDRGSYKSKEIQHEGDFGDQTIIKTEYSRSQRPGDFQRLKEILSRVPEGSSE